MSQKTVRAVSLALLKIGLDDAITGKNCMRIEDDYLKGYFIGLIIKPRRKPKHAPPEPARPLFLVDW